MARVLVTGASGLLGTKLVKILANRGHEVIAVYHSRSLPRVQGVKSVQLDIRDRVRLEDLILKTQPEVVVHAAAYTDVDGCERNKSLAWSVNVSSTRSIVRVSRVVNAHIIYISTDYIFDGEKGLYREDDIANPVNYYGLTKLVAEELVKSSELLYTIIRPSAIYGVGGSKKSFAEFIVEKLVKGQPVKALVDQYVSPTYNGLLALAIAEIIDLRPLGILHVAGPRMSRYEFARQIAELFDLPSDLIQKAKIQDMRGLWLARRPRDSSLDVSKARSLLKTAFYDLKDALMQFKNDMMQKAVQTQS